MANANLHGDGWRQGSLVRAILSAQVLDQDDQGRVITVEYDLWLLATQDCDLAWTKRTDAHRMFELRPVFTRAKTETIDGIRSKTTKVTDDLVLRADSPRLMLTARALTALKANRENTLDETRRREIKTWLGLRYDRPAVPDWCEPTHNTIVAKLGSLGRLGSEIRDILVYYHEDVKCVNMFVVLRDGKDKDAITDWLDDKIGDLLDDGIVVKARYVEDSSNTPLKVIETYYSLFSTEHSISAEAP